MFQKSNVQVKCKKNISGLKIFFFKADHHLSLISFPFYQIKTEFIVHLFQDQLTSLKVALTATFNNNFKDRNILKETGV
jgi:hypothetical protein